MTLTHLAALRQNPPKMTPMQFVTFNPGCWVQYYDDSPAKDQTKALSTRTFNVLECERKQWEGCAVCFSLQAFGESRTKQGLLCYRNLGVDVDLVAPKEKNAISGDEIDQRKEVYLDGDLLKFPLKPHWLIETRHGFHVVFRILGQRHPDGIRAAEALNSRLVTALHGDPNAALLTQVLRVPGTRQYKDPTHPFLCQLLIDNGLIVPYPLAVVRSALDQWEAQSGSGIRAPQYRPGPESGARVARWRRGLAGVTEGERNATASSLVGKIIGRLPEELWEIAGWGGLKEWNARNTVPLPESELRAVFESIARRERTRRRTGATRTPPASA